MELAKLTRTEIIDKLKEILLAVDDRPGGNIANCTEASMLVEDLGLSSVDILYMVISIEENFGVIFESVGVNDFSNLGAVVDYIEKNQQ